MLKAISKGARYCDLGVATTYAASKLRARPKDIISTKDEMKLASKLIHKYRNFVRRKCKIKDSIEPLITDIYNDLFDKLGSKYNFRRYKGKHGGEYVYPHNSSIYTTSYDSIVETYWQGIEDDLWKSDANTLVLDTEKYEGDVLNLVKLYGSLDWFRLDNGVIVKLDTLKQAYRKRKVKGEVMLYPIQQKDLYLYPWFNLFSRFKQDLQNTKTWIVIGYNFNDEFIRSIRSRYKEY